MTNNIKKNSSIFLDFVKNAITASPKVQKNFLNITESFAETIYKILKEEDLIMKLSYDGKDFWKRNNDKISCFDLFPDSSVKRPLSLIDLLSLILLILLSVVSIYSLILFIIISSANESIVLTQLAISLS